MTYRMALDQGTTSSRCIIFNEQGEIVSLAAKEFPQHFPRAGWVEHDADEIWESQILSAHEALLKAGLTAANIAAIGITNQRETTVLWDRETGKPVCPAIVWQCRRTAEYCDTLRAQGLEEMIRAKTGLPIDAYFSATKLRWMLENHAGLRARAERGELCFGTIDSFLIYRLTGGRVHATDASNAARTLLFNIHTLQWDEELLHLFDVPASLLPEVRPSAGHFGDTDAALFSAPIPLTGVAGDQQAALFGQCCFDPGQVKNTYGTGCFTLMNIGKTPVKSQNGLLTSIGWQLRGKTTYALEGSVFNAGSSIQWLRDELGLIGSASECDRLAETVPDNGGVYLVSAFTGLGAPHWDMYARGAILGITRGVTRAHIARAALEGIAYQVRDLVHTMSLDTGRGVESLWVDGGAAVSDFLLQFQADLLGCGIHRPTMVETTAAGAAYLAGLAVGFWPNTDALRQKRALDRSFTPTMSPDAVHTLLQKWEQAVSRAKDWEQGGQ